MSLSLFHPQLPISLPKQVHNTYCPTNIPTWPSILEIIIHRRPLALRHALLLAVHLGHLPTARRLIRLLIITHLDKPRKTQTNALLTRRVDTLLDAGLVPRAQRQVGRLDLPDVAGLEPHVGLVLPARRVRVKRLRTVNDNLRELLVQLLEHGLAEARADVADCFVAVGRGAVAGQQEGAVD